MKETEILKKKPIYSGYNVGVSNLLMYETYYDVLEPFFGPENKQLPCLDTESSILSVNTNNIVTDMKKQEHLFDFCSFFKENSLLSKENEKVSGKFETETTESIC